MNGNEISKTAFNRVVTEVKIANDNANRACRKFNQMKRENFIDPKSHSEWSMKNQKAEAERTVHHLNGMLSLLPSIGLRHQFKGAKIEVMRNFKGGK